MTHPSSGESSSGICYAFLCVYLLRQAARGLGPSQSKLPRPSVLYFVSIYVIVCCIWTMNSIFMCVHDEGKGSMLMDDESCLNINCRLEHVFVVVQVVFTYYCDIINKLVWSRSIFFMSGWTAFLASYRGK